MFYYMHFMISITFFSNVNKDIFKFEVFVPRGTGMLTRNIGGRRRNARCSRTCYLEVFGGIWRAFAISLSQVLRHSRHLRPLPCGAEFRHQGQGAAVSGEICMSRWCSVKAPNPSNPEHTGPFHSEHGRVLQRERRQLPRRQVCKATLGNPRL